MYELSDVAAKDIEQILDRSIVDFGLPQTELYYHSLGETGVSLVLLVMVTSQS